MDRRQKGQKPETDDGRFRMQSSFPVYDTDFYSDDFIRNPCRITRPCVS
jgi:hypothetical protein